MGHAISIEQRTNFWDDLESELGSADREMCSLHLAWPSSTAMVMLHQEIEARRSGHTHLPFPQ
jgi:hypothetical protein